MKNLHFCTPELLRIIKDKKIKVFHTYRTGFVPNLYPGDIINLNERDDEGNDTYIKEGVVKSVAAVRVLNIHEGHIKEAYKEEIDRYRRKFHKMHYFFAIQILKDTKRMYKFAESQKEGRR